jgi:DNA-binding protein Fis
VGGPKSREKRIAAIIAKVQKQRRALDEILRALHELERNSPPRAANPPTLDDHERGIVASALKQAGGNQTKAARILGIGRDRLRYKISKYKIRW